MQAPAGAGPTLHAWYGPPMSGPLSDLVVLDLTRALSGPVAGRLLADLGADVIKVEPPGGDLTRSIVPRVEGQSVYFVQYNVGKRCVSIDLASEAGVELFMQLVERADVVLENYRPDVMARLGLTYEALAERNPRIIVASISGWGHHNSRSAQGAYAASIHAEVGVTAGVAAARDDDPRNDPLSHADVYGGLHCLAALLAAVHHRDVTGRGQAVEVSMAESTLMANDSAPAELSGIDVTEGFRAGQHRTPVYRLSTGRGVAITIDPTTPAGFETFWRAMERPELAEDERFATSAARIANRAPYDEVIGAWIATIDDAATLERRLANSTVLAAEVRTVPELASTPWAAERGAFVEVPVGDTATVRVTQSPWRFSDGETGVRPVIGYRGQHNREVLRDLLGLSDARIDELEAQGVVSDRPPRRPR